MPSFSYFRGQSASRVLVKIHMLLTWINMASSLGQFQTEDVDHEKKQCHDQVRSDLCKHSLGINRHILSWWLGSPITSETHSILVPLRFSEADWIPRDCCRCFCFISCVTVSISCWRPFGNVSRIARCLTCDVKAFSVHSLEVTLYPWKCAVIFDPKKRKPKRLPSPFWTRGVLFLMTFREI